MRSLFFLLVLLAPTICAQDRLLSTIAGTGLAGYSGDDGKAISAKLNMPSAVAISAGGEIFIADSGNNRIREVDTTGSIMTVAGTGKAGYSGDGGPATSARLFAPGGVAVDRKGSLYISDTYNSRIRKVDPNGTIINVAGTGEAGYSGDDGPATSAQLNGPGGIATDDNGNLYIADTHNYRIRKVDAKGNISTVAGIGTPGYSGDDRGATSAQLNEPSAVTVDKAGDLLIADSLNHRIRRVDAAGTIITIAGDGTAGFSGDSGPAVSAMLSYPTGLATDETGNLYVADSPNHRIRMVDIRGIITTVAGVGTPGYSGDGGSAASAQLNFPAGIGIGIGNVYVADQTNNSIRMISALRQ